MQDTPGADFARSLVTAQRILRDMRANTRSFALAISNGRNGISEAREALRLSQEMVDKAAVPRRRS